MPKLLWEGAKYRLIGGYQNHADFVLEVQTGTDALGTKKWDRIYDLDGLDFTDFITEIRHILVKYYETHISGG